MNIIQRPHQHTHTKTEGERTKVSQAWNSKGPEAMQGKNKEANHVF